MKNKKVVLLFGILFLIVLFGNINIANAEVLKCCRGNYSPNSGMSVEINAVSSDYDFVYWTFETEENEFMVDVILYDELENEQIVSQGKTEGSGIIVLSEGLYELKFMNYDIYSGYMEIFVGLNEAEEEETVSITSVHVEPYLIIVEYETTGRVFWIDLALYYGEEFVTEIYNGSQVPLHNSFNWGYDKEDIFSGDLFRIKITDSDDLDVYSFSDYFTIEFGDIPTPEPTISGGIPLIQTISVIGIASAICVTIFILVFKNYRKKHPKKDIKEVIKPEIIPIKLYCSECGTEILDKSRKFCTTCGTEIIN